MKKRLPSCCNLISFFPSKFRSVFITKRLFRFCWKLMSNCQAIDHDRGNSDYHNLSKRFQFFLQLQQDRSVLVVLSRPSKKLEKCKLIGYCASRKWTWWTTVVWLGSISTRVMVISDVSTKCWGSLWWNGKNMTDDVIVVFSVIFCEMKPLDTLQWHHDLYIVDREEATLAMDGTFIPTIWKF